MNNSIVKRNDVKSEDKLTKVALVKQSCVQGHHIWKTMDNVGLNDVVLRVDAPALATTIVVLEQRI